MICPAYVEPGRLTIDSLHWTRTPEGMIPVAQSEFAKDASGYRSSDLRDWVEEKTGGRNPRDEVATITLTDIRVGGPDRVGEILAELSNGQPVVVDTVEDADQQVVVLALLRAEASGKNFIYRIGPSFVRARTGQRATPPADAQRLRRSSPGGRPTQETRPATKHGLIAVGSHVGLTTRQLDRLRIAARSSNWSSMSTLLDDSAREQHVNDIAGQAARALQSNDAESDIVIRTSRTLVTGAMRGQPGDRSYGQRRAGRHGARDREPSPGRPSSWRRAASPHPTPRPRAWEFGEPGAAARCCPASSRSGASYRACSGHPVHRVRRKRGR